MGRLSGPNRHATNNNRTKGDFIETPAHVPRLLCGAGPLTLPILARDRARPFGIIYIGVVLIR